MNNKVRIGTRGSALALKQTNAVAGAIGREHPELEIEIVPIRTTGDKLQDVSLAKIGGKGVFVKEIEDALLKGEIDLAVHSMKDVPSEIPDGLVIGAVPERADPRDVLISRSGARLEALPPGARIGTGSLRRGVQLKHHFPSFEIVPIRGNLDTRIRKIETEGLAGIILAAAGLERLGWEGRVSQLLPEEFMIPAIGQGALALEARRDDQETLRRIAFLDHRESRTAVSAERAFLKVFGGGCQLPIAAHALLGKESLRVIGMIGNLGGEKIIREEITGAPGKSEALGKELAERILDLGGRKILQECLGD